MGTSPREAVRSSRLPRTHERGAAYQLKARSHPQQTLGTEYKLAWNGAVWVCAGEPQHSIRVSEDEWFAIERTATPLLIAAAESIERPAGSAVGCLVLVGLVAWLIFYYGCDDFSLGEVRQVASLSYLCAPAHSIRTLASRPLRRPLARR